MNNSPPLEEHDQPHRRAVLVALLWITAVSGIIFATLNVGAGNVAVAVAEIVMAVYSLFLLWAIRDTDHLNRWMLAYTLPFFSTMMFALFAPRSTVSVFGWVLLIPILAHLLHGRRLGLALSVMFTAIAGALFFLKFRHSSELMQPIPILNMAILTLCVLTFSHVYEVSRERSEKQLLRLARTDPLTGLANRAMFREYFERENRRSQRRLTPLSLILFDLDFFKSVNDRYGHEVGDRTLVQIAALIRKRLRLSDLACRLGGEEFGILMPDTTAAQALQVAEMLRQTLAERPLVFGDVTLSQTLSAGIAEIGLDGSTVEDLLGKADERLYAAKGQGRNCVVGPEWLDAELASSTG
ncbi:MULTISPECIES: GGDEF domain-containing protein [Marinobacter]|uniref:GGDEF domain-containing protein n=1 Tax=Marinobacter TaxID=2742 RepID=UPI000DAC51C4|nr:MULTISPECIES: GGDEF domain-containing protein [Marinobacter]